VCTELPAYTWPKKSIHHATLTTSDIELAREYNQAKRDVAAYMAELPSRMRMLGRIMNAQDAALLQILAGIANELQALGIPPTRAIITAAAEVGTLTSTGHESLTRLRLARSARVASSEGEFEGWVSGKAAASGGYLIEGCTFKVYPK